MRRSWPHYPFLVITESLNNEVRNAWMPYWHVVTFADGRPTETKFGQWAAHLDLELFSDLIEQAHATCLLS